MADTPELSGGVPTQECGDHHKSVTGGGSQCGLGTLQVPFNTRKRTIS